LNIGCDVADINVSLLAYADDLVLLAPSWRALQSLLRAVKVAGVNINITFNTRKTVCMSFNPSDRCKSVAETSLHLRFVIVHYCLLINLNIWAILIITFLMIVILTEKSERCSQEPIYCVDVSNDAHWL